MIQSNLIGAFWTPCDPDAPDSTDSLTLTYADGTTKLSGEDARRAMDRFYKRSLTKQIALTFTPDLTQQQAA